MNYRARSRSYINTLYDIDVTQFADTDLEKHVGNTKLICSNAFRIIRLNLSLYEQVVKSNDRFRLLMAIASKRYSGKNHPFYYTIIYIYIYISDINMIVCRILAIRLG